MVTVAAWLFAVGLIAAGGVVLVNFLLPRRMRPALGFLLMLALAVACSGAWLFVLHALLEGIG